MDDLVAMTAGEQNDMAARAALGLLGLGIVAFFVLSLVRACTWKTTGWILGAAISGFLTLLVILGLIGQGVSYLEEKGVEARKRQEAAVARTAKPAVAAAGEPKTEFFSRDGDMSVKMPQDWQREKDAPAGDAVGLSMIRGQSTDQFMVLSWEKAAFPGGLQSPHDAWLKAMMAKMEGAQTTTLSAEPLGPYPARRARLEGELKHLKLVYATTAVETNDRYYILLGWTAKSRSEATAPLFQEMVESFQAKAGPPGEKEEEAGDE